MTFRQFCQTLKKLDDPVDGGDIRMREQITIDAPIKCENNPYRDGELRHYEIRRSVLGFIEEIETLILAAGLLEDRPELADRLTPCEMEKMIKGGRWRRTLDVWWDKAQRIRGILEDDDDKRSCFGTFECSACSPQVPMEERAKVSDRVNNYRLNEEVRRWRKEIVR
jgi:hypothetical protein